MEAGPAIDVEEAERDVEVRERPAEIDDDPARPPTLPVDVNSLIPS